LSGPQNQQVPQLADIYRQFQTAHTTEANVIEMLFNEVQSLGKKNTELVIELMKAKAELEAIKNPPKVKKP